MEQADGRGPARRRTWRVERVRSGWGRPLSGRSFSLSSTFHVGILLLLAPLDGARPVGAAPRRSVQVVVRPPAPEPRPVFEDVVETVVVPSLDDVVPEVELEPLPLDPELPWLAEEEPLLLYVDQPVEAVERDERATEAFTERPVAQVEVRDPHAVGPRTHVMSGDFELCTRAVDRVYLVSALGELGRHSSRTTADFQH